MHAARRGRHRSGQEAEVSATTARVLEVHLWPLGTSVLYFHEDERLQQPMERGMGVICHITSVPNDGEPGTLGEPAKRFVDKLAEAGQTYWQVLPVNPTDQFGSPYAGLSAFAGNPYLIEGFQTTWTSSSRTWTTTRTTRSSVRRTPTGSSPM